MLHKQQNEQRSQGARKGRNAHTNEGYLEQKHVKECLTTPEWGTGVVEAKKARTDSKREREGTVHTVSGHGRKQAGPHLIIRSTALPHS